MTSVVYRERDREYDSRTNVSSTRRDRDGGYTTVKRYIVKDDDARSSYGGRDSRSFVPERTGERVEETRIIRREADVEEPPRREPRREEARYSNEEIVIRRDREDDRREPYYERRPPERSSDQELIIRRTTESDEPRRDDLAVSRFDDRREQRYDSGYEVVRRGDPFDRDRDVQRYSRTTDYYAPAPQPQIVVLKQDPIIIRERVRDDDYQVVRKTDIEEEKSVVRRQPEPPKEEEYFYEKKVRERIDDGRRRSRSRDDDWRERRVMKREVSPHDSVSQVGGRRDYSSDDSMVYVKRTKEVETNGSPSPDRRKNLAAGAIAGIGAAELLRNHKKKEGRETSHGIGRLGRDVGAAGLGAVAAEGISRARSAYRSRSRRRRSRSSSRDSGRSRRHSRSRRRSRSRSESRSRSHSRSKLKTLGAVGLGAAALAAAAAVATKKMKNKDEAEAPPRGRSSSRHRTDRVESMKELTNDPDADDARNPKHRNKRMAEAGAAGAAITALIDRARSKSRGRDRSRSRIRQAAPIVAAGLGSAALAGLYERNKAKNEAEVIQKDERRAARSRSRSRARSEYTEGYRDGALNDPGLIEYGDGPMHGNNYGEGYYGRPAPQEGYYANQTAVVPAPGTGAPAAYGASRDMREPSPAYGRDRRSRSRSRSSSPGGGHRSGRRRAADAAGAAGAGAAAAGVYERTKAEKRERKARKRREQEQYGDPYDEGYNPQGAYAPQAADPYAAHTQTGGYYPEGGAFPPPPGAASYMPDPVAAQQGGYPGQQYAPPPPGGAMPPPPGAPGYEPYVSGANPYAQPRGPDNVSVPNYSVPDGLNTSRSVDPMPPPPPGPPPFANPSINVRPPSTQPDPTQPPPAASYIPPTETPRTASPPRDRNLDLSPEPTTRPRATSQPPPSSAANGPRKSVQFAAHDDVQPVDPPASEASIPEGERTRRRRRDRGYEAGDDTDSTADEQRRRNRGLDPGTADREPADRDDDNNGKRHHRRRRSHDPSSSSSRRDRDRDGDRDRDRDRPNGSSRSSKDKGKQRQTDNGNGNGNGGGDSDATEELPPRFDTEGHKKPERGEDPVADRLEDLISGKGAAGKVFGNFVDGLFGPERGKKRDH